MTGRGCSDAPIDSLVHAQKDDDVVQMDLSLCEQSYIVHTICKSFDILFVFQ